MLDPFSNPRLQNLEVGGPGMGVESEWGGGGGGLEVIGPDQLAALGRWSD